ncbi:MAG: peptide deformylase [Chlamydiales bacterium]|nr:peptide deformylase [Chlamydiales bacterium]
MKLSLIYYGNSILRKKAIPVEEITEEIRRLVHDMDAVMLAHNGAGLAAPQVGVSLRLFIMRIEKEEEKEATSTDKKEPILPDLQVFINPTLFEPSDELFIYNEGCLSIPKVRADVIRPAAIYVEATDLDGNLIKRRFSGLEARCIMHENDHLNGVLYIDRLSKKERDHLDPALREIKKKFR